MKFFAIFFLVGTLLCAGFWLHDGPGSGMGLATGAFVLIGGGTLLNNKLRNGGWLREGPKSLNDRADGPG